MTTTRGSLRSSPPHEARQLLWHMLIFVVPVDRRGACSVSSFARLLGPTLVIVCRGMRSSSSPSAITVYVVLIVDLRPELRRCPDPPRSRYHLRLLSLPGMNSAIGEAQGVGGHGPYKMRDGTSPLPQRVTPSERLCVLSTRLLLLLDAALSLCKSPLRDMEARRSLGHPTSVDRSTY